jgi:hypothetical protein
MQYWSQRDFFFFFCNGANFVTECYEHDSVALNLNLQVVVAVSVCQENTGWAVGICVYVTNNLI